MIITIDGPASSGKGTVARILARHLDAFHLDSGLLYRALAYYCDEKNIDVSEEDPSLYQEFRENFHMEYDFSTQKARMMAQDNDITALLRQQSIGKKASQIAKFPQIRQLVTQKIRALERRFCSIVADGRDMGSIVFPHADFHFYLDAALSIRSQRRFEELVAKGVQVTLEEVTNEIAARDLQDRSRSLAPLVITPTTQAISTDLLSPYQVLDTLMQIIESRADRE